MLRLVPVPPPSKPTREPVEPANETELDKIESGAKSGRRKRRPWWVDEFVAIEARVREALVRR
jgi:hypothetical protein